MFEDILFKKDEIFSKESKIERFKNELVFQSSSRFKTEHENLKIFKGKKNLKKNPKKFHPKKREYNKRIKFRSNKNKIPLRKMFQKRRRIFKRSNKNKFIKKRSNIKKNSKSYNK